MEYGFTDEWVLVSTEFVRGQRGTFREGYFAGMDGEREIWTMRRDDAYVFTYEQGQRALERWYARHPSKPRGTVVLG